MYQYWFINCDKRTILMQDVNDRENWVWGIQELSAQPSQLFCELKLLENKNVLKIIFRILESSILRQRNNHYSGLSVLMVNQPYVCNSSQRLLPLGDVVFCSGFWTSQVYCRTDGLIENLQSLSLEFKILWASMPEHLIKLVVWIDARSPFEMPQNCFGPQLQGDLWEALCP